MFFPKYVTKMIPFWQKAWILLKQLLLLFWKICLLQTNLSCPQASSQDKPALPRGHLSIRTISFVRNGLLPLLPASHFGRASLWQRLEFYQFCWAPSYQSPTFGKKQEKIGHS